VVVVRDDTAAAALGAAQALSVHQWTNNNYIWLHTKYTSYTNNKAAISYDLAHSVLANERACFYKGLLLLLLT
jgi:hypothetical protein